jgi:hypothetical protein
VKTFSTSEPAAFSALALSKASVAAVTAVDEVRSFYAAAEPNLAPIVIALEAAETSLLFSQTFPFFILFLTPSISLCFFSLYSFLQSS